MAGNTKIRVLRAGVPVPDAHVLVGDIVGERLKTNENGKVDFDLAEGWRGFVHVFIDAGDTTAIAMIDLKSGETEDVEIASLPQA